MCVDSAMRHFPIELLTSRILLFVIVNFCVLAEIMFVGEQNHNDNNALYIEKL